jgi:drug/metabolite transporter (DMT)-like permease
MWTALAVATRIVANPVSNVFQKQLASRGAHPALIIAATHALLTAVCLPALAGAAPVRLQGEFWANMAVCVVLAVSSNVLLVYALQSSDLSVLGPVNAYKAVISLALGTVLIGEVPSAGGLCGVLLIVGGSWFVVDRDPGQPKAGALARFFRTRGIQLRLAALVLSATEAVFLKRAMLAASPVTTFVCWSVLGLPVAVAGAALLLRKGGRGQLRIAVSEWRTCLWLAASTGAMQLTTLLTFGALQVGYSLALFQLSSLLSVLLGRHFFQEGNIARRLAGSAIMVAGAALIVAQRSRG